MSTAKIFNMPDPAPGIPTGNADWVAGYQAGCNKHKLAMEKMALKQEFVDAVRDFDDLVDRLERSMVDAERVLNAVLGLRRELRSKRKKR